MPDPDEVYATEPELRLLKEPSTTRRAATTTVLMGTFLSVLEKKDSWLRVTAFGEEGWVPVAKTAAADSTLKFFFVDVGQGDGVLVESAKARVVVDGGQMANFSRYLTKWKYKYLLRAGFQVRLDAIVISHFDADHYAGLTEILDDRSYKIGTIIHAGIARYSDKSTLRPPGVNTDLGTAQGSGASKVLEPSFDTLADAKQLLADGGLQPTFADFLTAAVKANEQGRLEGMKRVVAGDSLDVDLGPNTSVEVLGPIPEADGNLRWFEDSSHTVNGHSVVLRFDCDTRSFLLGGDLNDLSQDHLLAKAADPDRFTVDVAKACHHGASEFSVDFLKKVKPFATVFSSGDNENYGHPQADALGATARYSRGLKPLIFSTELARSTSADDIHYGLINVRTDGQKVVLAQMFEKGKGGDMWNSFTLD